MSNVLEFPLPELVAPGNAINLSVTLTAPGSPGHYRGYWMLRNTSGKRFGSGSNADKAIFVDIYSVSSGSPKGAASGRICYPSERIPPMTLYLQNIDRGNLASVAIKADQGSYQVQLDPGTYFAYAWTLDYELAGSYGSAEHPLERFVVKAGKTTTGIDICDWYHAPGEIPFPDPSKYGTIKGSLSFPGETIPPLRIIAFNAYDYNAYFWVDTVENQETFEIKGLQPGNYVLVAYVKSGHMSGGYTELVKCGLQPGCPRDHDLVVIHVDPGAVVRDIDPVDWFTLPGTYPPDPTR